MKLLAPLLLVAIAVAGSPAIAAAEAVTPQRPSFSADPSTTAPGTLELEAGYFASDAESADLPFLLKWGSGPQTELFVGWSPWTMASEDTDGPGDVGLGIRHRFFERADGSLSLAYQLAGKIPTADADEGLGTGVPDLALAFTSLRPFESFNLVGYYQLGLLGRADRTGALVDHALAVAVGGPLADSISGFVEWTGTWRPELRSSDSQWLAGVGYTVRPWLVLDAAGGLVLQPGDDDLTLSLGCTVNLGPAPGWN